MAVDYHPMPRALGDQTESDLHGVPVEYRDDIRRMVAAAYAEGHRDGWLYGVRTTVADHLAREEQEVTR